MASNQQTSAHSGYTMMNYDYPLKLEKEALVIFSHVKSLSPNWDQWGEIWESLQKHRKKSEDRCWMDLTVVSGPKKRWPTVKGIRKKYSNSLNPDVKFHVTLIDPWMVHIEMTEDEGGWTAQEVLSLPDWFVIGGTFEEDALSCGYSKNFVKEIKVYGTDPTNKISDSSTTEVVDPSDRINPYIEYLVYTEPDPQTFLQTLRSNILLIGELGRFDMEIIAKVSNCFRFSACVSSSDDFKADVLSGTNSGDTIATWQRFIRNEEYKGGKIDVKEERAILQ